MTQDMIYMLNYLNVISLNTVSILHFQIQLHSNSNHSNECNDIWQFTVNHSISLIEKQLQFNHFHLTETKHDGATWWW